MKAAEEVPRQTVRSFERVRDGKRHVVPGYERAQKKPRWTNESIIQAVQKWVELYGQPPASADWNPSAARYKGTPARQARYHNGVWPSAATVVRHFGAWSRAIEAAGYEAALPGALHNDDLRGRLSSAQKLSRRNLARLRNSDVATRHAGPTALAKAMKAAIAAEKTDEPELLQDKLLELAAVAVAWADRADR